MRTGFVVAVLAVAMPAGAADYPKVELSTKDFKMKVYLPDVEKGFYRGSRFCWAGVLGDIEYGRWKMFQSWKDKHDPTNNDDIIGPVIEFGNVSPLGYNEAKVGESFVKIGVGELLKPKEEKYSFFTNYKVVNPGVWRVTRSKKDKPDDPDEIEFRQSVTSKSGYGYHLLVGVRIYCSSRPGVGGNYMTLNYELINTGTKKIVTDVYNHNFFNVDKQPVGPKYYIGFTGAVEQTADSEFGDRAKILGQGQFKQARFMDAVLTFPNPLQKQAAFGRVLSKKDKAPFDGGFVMSFNETDDKYVDVFVGGEGPGKNPRKRFQVWSINTVMCPEPFYDVVLEPSESVTWTTKYKFETPAHAMTK
jgi:hypothetical protein